MKTLELLGVVDETGELSVHVQTDLPPGEHRLFVVVDEEMSAPTRKRQPLNLPSLDVGKILPGFSLRREDIYGERG